MYKYVIDQSPSGYEIYVNLIQSSAGKYISRKPYLIGLIKEVLSGMNLAGPKLSIERDMGRVIGNTDIVDTTEKDTIYYAQPLKISVFSRYAKNRYSLPSKQLTIILERDADGSYEVHNTWIGPYTPPFPGDKNETSDSKTYWQNHALVQDSQTVQTKTITKLCPY